VDKISSLTLNLQNGTSLTSAINSANNAKLANVTLDASSQWNVTADLYITSLTGATILENSVRNISGNGHAVYYNASACIALNNQIYSLNGGGYLQPSE
jgi:uncharacterized UPF0146 family protein